MPAIIVLLRLIRPWKFIGGLMTSVDFADFAYAVLECNTFSRSVFKGEVAPHRRRDIQFTTRFLPYDE